MSLQHPCAETVNIQLETEWSTTSLWNSIFIHNFWHLDGLDYQSWTQTGASYKHQKREAETWHIPWTRDIRALALCVHAQSQVKSTVPYLHYTALMAAQKPEQQIRSKWCRTQTTRSQVSHIYMRNEMMQCCVVWCMDTYILRKSTALIFKPKDGGSQFFCITGIHIPNYMALQPRTL